ncbi:hypothetical protein M3J09_013175 [Ascochyta lentis]
MTVPSNLRPRMRFTSTRQGTRTCGVSNWESKFGMSKINLQGQGCQRLPEPCAVNCQEVLRHQTWISGILRR